MIIYKGYNTNNNAGRIITAGRLAPRVAVCHAMDAMSTSGQDQLQASADVLRAQRDGGDHQTDTA